MSYTLVEILGGRITDYRGSVTGTFEIHAVPNEAFTASDGTIVQPKNYRIIPVTATTTSQTAGGTTMSVPQLVFGNFILYANDNAVVNKLGTYRFELWHNGKKLYTLAQYSSVKVPSDVNSISWITLATYNNPLGLPNIDQTVFSKEQTLSLLGGMVDQSGRITALETEVWAARNAYPSIDTRMDAMDAEIAASASASAVATLQADVTIGHGAYASLDARFNALSASLAATTLDNLADVVTPTPASGNFLHYDGHNWTNTFLTVGDIPNNIPATKIFDGSISDTEFGYLDGLTGNIQAQLNIAGTGNTGFVANTNAKRDANAALSASQYFVGNTDVNLQRVVVDLSRGVTQTGMGVYNDTTTANPGVLVAHRLYVGEQPGDNPQGALYSDGVRITQKWYGNPAAYDKFQGLYVYNSIQDLTSGNTSSQDIYGVDSQTGIYDVVHDTHVPTAYNIWTIYGGHFIAYHQAPGNVSDGMIGVMGKSWEYSNATTPANVAKHRGVQGWAATMAGSNSNTTASRGVYGILENNGTGTMTEGSGGYFFINTNNGVITTASGVRIGNINIGGSGTAKYGLYVEAQNVVTPGNWTTIANIYSAGSTSLNIFDGQIKSTLASGTAPLIVASNTLVSNLNSDFLNGHHSSDFANVVHTHVHTDITDWNSAVDARISYPVTSVAGRTGVITLSNTDISGLGTSSTKDVASSGNASSTQVVLGSDTRLSDARTPLAHTHPHTDITDWNAAVDARINYPVTSVAGRTGVIILSNTDISGLGTASVKNVAASGNAATTEVVMGNDTRLSDARTPVAHIHAIADVTLLQSTLDAKVIYNATRTLNRITKWTDATNKEIGNSLLLDDGTNVSLVSGSFFSATYSVSVPSTAATSTAGNNVLLSSSNAVAGSSTASAAAGGDVNITAGNAARLTSGNANGGNINLTPGTGVGTGTSGNVTLASGQLLLPDGSNTNPSIAFSGATNSGLFRNGAASVGIAQAGTITALFNGITTHVGTLNISTSIGTTQVLLQADAANTLALRNSTNAQTQRWYASYTDASNNEGLQLNTTTSASTFSPFSNGTGTKRDIVFTSSTVGEIMRLNATSNSVSIKQPLTTQGISFQIDNTYDIGASGANRPRNLYIAGTGTGALFNGTSGLASGAYVSVTTWLGWASKSEMLSPSDGIITLTNLANTDFSRLQFGGSTASFPALKRNSTALEVKLADDSAYTTINALTYSIGLPTQATTTTAGNAVTLSASNAVAGSATAGAAAGGDVNITAGNAARLTSGNANGGNINLTTGSGIGTGVAGSVLIPQGLSTALALAFNGASTTGLTYNSGIGIFVGGTEIARASTGSLFYSFANSTVIYGTLGFGSTNDVILTREAANILAMRNSTNAQEQRWYNTYTDSSNYERGSLGWTVNTNWLTLRTTNLGTGSARGIIIDSATAILAFNGITSSFPAFKRSSTTLQARLADDSAFTNVSVASLLLNGSTSGAITLSTPATVTSHTLIMPSANASGVLTNDGSGNLSWSAASGGSAYTVYRALLSQSGTSAPTAVVLENTLGITPTFSRIAAGSYTLNATSTFPSASKTGIIVGSNYVTGGSLDDAYIIAAAWSDSGHITIKVSDQNAGQSFSGGADAILNNIYLEIRVYP